MKVCTFPLWLVTFAAITGLCHAEVPSGTPADPDWALLASSTRILRGRLKVPKVELEDATKARKDRPIKLQLAVTDAIKGTMNARVVECDYWAGEKRDAQSPKSMMQLSGEKGEPLKPWASGPVPPETIQDGGSEEQRRGAVDGWRVYLHYRLNRAR